MVEQGWHTMATLRVGNIGPSMCCSCLVCLCRDFRHVSGPERPQRSKEGCPERRINPGVSLTLTAYRCWLRDCDFGIRKPGLRAHHSCAISGIQVGRSDCPILNQTRHGPVGVLPEARDVTFHCRTNVGLIFHGWSRGGVGSPLRHVGMLGLAARLPAGSHPAGAVAGSLSLPHQAPAT